MYPTDLHKPVALGKAPNDTLQRAADIKGELLIVYGRQVCFSRFKHICTRSSWLSFLGQDPHVPVEGRRAVYDALVKAERFFSWHEFNASHAFMRDESSSGRYDPALAGFVYQLIMELFGRRLHSDETTVAPVVTTGPSTN
jgi:carboxymethylenebutenolidase